MSLAALVAATALSLVAPLTPAGPGGRPRRPGWTGRRQQELQHADPVVGEGQEGRRLPGPGRQRRVLRLARVHCHHGQLPRGPDDGTASRPELLAGAVGRRGDHLVVEPGRLRRRAPSGCPCRPLRATARRSSSPTTRRCCAGTAPRARRRTPCSSTATPTSSARSPTPPRSRPSWCPTPWSSAPTTGASSPPRPPGSCRSPRPRRASPCEPLAAPDPDLPAQQRRLQGAGGRPRLGSCHRARRATTCRWPGTRRSPRSKTTRPASWAPATHGRSACDNNQYWWRVRAIDLLGQATPWTTSQNGFQPHYPEVPTPLYPLGTRRPPRPSRRTTRT